VAPAPRKRGHPPVLKKYGQHFLSDGRILAAIVDALAPTATDRNPAANEIRAPIKIRL